ncbi:HipA-like protein [Acetobacter pomorum]|uniref:HipA-like protein n=1 Tax=Acetobacter pomorum TaxID=65959 RepID=A0A2G4R858_9PROT|nr:type II toxin-antitoxin system HipA family toxin [Acetobacter pomorum]PHY92748.1 HipA-like protein [Acetobacter pomorum]
MMVDLAVLVSGKVCARATDKGGSPRIFYDMDSEGVREGHSLSLSMPPQKEAYGGGVVLNWLRNLLPEDPQDLKAIARDVSGGLPACSSKNPLRLLEKIGEDCAGAVQVVQEDRIAKVREEGGIKRVSEAEVENMIHDIRSGRSVAGRIPEHNNGRFSLAGAQKKTALRRLPDGSWGIPYGKEPTTHIMKPPMPDMKGQVEGEHFCLTLCRRIGLTAAKSEVLQFGSEKVICVERFDRSRDEKGDVHRFHVEDMCQALGIDPARKYQNDGGPGTTEISGHVLSRSMDPDVDREALMRAMVVNWVLMGTDAHAKNYSIYIHPLETLQSEQKVSLAPLYDVNTFAPYEGASWSTNSMSMSVDGKYVFSKIHKRHWQIACQKAGFHPPDGHDKWLEQTVRSIRDVVPTVLAITLNEGLDPEWMVKISKLTRNRAEMILKDMFCSSST